MSITTALAIELHEMTDKDLLGELTRPTTDIEYKLYINSIALYRILEKQLLAWPNLEVSNIRDVKEQND